MKTYSPKLAWVYFIRQPGVRGPVKIGYARRPEVRLRQIEKHSPVPLEIAATIFGTQHTERRFHALFVADFYRDEWFHGSARMDAVIAQINAGAFDVDALPRSVALYLVARRRAQFAVAA